MAKKFNQTVLKSERTEEDCSSGSARHGPKLARLYSKVITGEKNVATTTIRLGWVRL